MRVEYTVLFPGNDSPTGYLVCYTTNLDFSAIGIGLGLAKPKGLKPRERQAFLGCAIIRTLVVTIVAIATFVALVTFVAFVAFVAFVTLVTFVAFVTLVAFVAFVAFVALVAFVAFVTLVAFVAFVTLVAFVALVTFVTFVAFVALRSGCTLFPLWTLFTSWSRITFVPFRPRRTFFAIVIWWSRPIGIWETEMEPWIKFVPIRVSRS
jgi:hypothetical protein